LKKRLGKKQDQIDDAVADILSNTGNITGNSNGIEEGFTATYQLLASSLLGDIGTAENFLAVAVFNGLTYTFASQTTMDGVPGTTYGGKGMFEINLGDIDATLLQAEEKRLLKIAYEKAMENNDAYGRLLDAVRNFGWDVFTDIETASVGGNEFTYESSLVSNLTNGTGAGDGAYIGTPIEMLMVGNVGAIRTFSFLSVAINKGELYGYKTTNVVTAPPLPYYVNSIARNLQYTGADVPANVYLLDMPSEVTFKFGADPNESGIQISIVAQSVNDTHQEALYTDTVSAGTEVNYNVSFGEAGIRALHPTLTTGDFKLILKYASLGNSTFGGTFNLGTIQ
jgi:hypothetical protein